MSAHAVEGFPLSPQQRHLWRLGAGEPGSPYRVGGRFPAAGVGAGRAARGLDAARRRHEILRTSFVTLPGLAEPLQSVDESVEESVDEAVAVSSRLPRLDLGGLAPQRSAAEGDRVAAAILGSGRGAAGLRAIWLQAATPELWLSLPALVADRHTLGLVASEVLGTGVGDGRVAEEEPEPLQYADLAGWLNGVLESPDAEAGVAFWRRQVGPGDLAGDGGGAGRDASAPGASPEAPCPRHRAVDGVDGADVAAAAGRLGVPARALLAALWGVVVGRRSGDQRPVVACAFAGRDFEELEDARGPLARHLPLPVPWAGDGSGAPSTAELATSVAAFLAEAEEWQQAFSWERVVSVEERSAHGLEGEPWLAAAVAWRDAGAGADGRLSGFEERCRVRLAAGPGEPLVLTWDAAALPAVEARRLADAVAACLGAALEAPTRPVSSLPVVGEAERRWQLGRSTDAGPAAVPAADPPVHRRFEGRAAAHPERVAVVGGDAAWSYGELDARANRLARHLRRRGVGLETPVALSLERSARMVEALLAVLKAGGFYVPVDPALPAERRDALLAESGAEVVLDDVSLDRLEAELAELSSDPLDVEVPMEGLAYRLYTSGSTGRPKGVEVTHANLAGYVASWLARVEPPPAASYATVSSLAADLGNTAVFPALAGGGTLHVLPLESVYDPAAVAAYLVEHRVDVLKVVPSHLAALLAGAPELRPPAILVCGGEALSWELAARVRERRPEVRLWNHYGPTEATVGVLTGEVPATPAAGAAPCRTVPLGTALSGEAAYALDASGEPAPAGVAGELYLGGRGIARGYAGRPAATAERFLPDPFSGVAGARLYRTGDRARALAAAAPAAPAAPTAPAGPAFEFLGRVDHQVKVRGHRVELGEVEAALRAQPGVAEAVVVLAGADDAEVAASDASGAALTAYLVADASAAAAPVEAEALRAGLARRLPDHMVPTTFVLLDEMPRLATGKVDRRALPAPESARRLAAGGEGIPRDLVEEMVADLWAEVLGAERVGVHEDFFALGGHSLLATRIVSRLRRSFDVEVPVRAFFRRPTVAGLVETLGELRRAAGDGPAGEAPPPLEPLSPDQVGEEGPPLSFAQHRLWFVDQLRPGNHLFNVPSPVRLRGDLDAAALARALAGVVRRHQVLRTVFPALPDGRPSQRVLPPAPVPLPRVDLSALPELGLDGAPCRRRELRRLARADRLRPFDLARGPLLRSTLVALGGAADRAEHALLLTLHHIATDAWSARVLTGELAALYASGVEGRPATLPALPVQYSDYAAWQRRWLSGDELERQVGYWRRRLAGAPEALAVPTDHPRPAEIGDRGEVEELEVDAALADDLRRLSREHGVTLFMTLLAAWQLLLAHLSGQRDVVVGTNVANRNRLETEHLVGFFINQLVLRTDLSGDPGFGELLARVRDGVLGAYDHQDLPFEKLVEELSPRRDASRSLLFQAKIDLQTAGPGDRLEVPGLTLEPLQLETRIARCDLHLSLADFRDHLRGTLLYATDLFTAATATRIVAAFLDLLAAVAAEPEAPLSTFFARLAAGEERHSRGVEAEYENAIFEKLTAIRS